ncbi:hypothetical protein ES319_D04G114600v1 [Gossypium barbadense]|uniref:SAC domain-containing protein n=4 Tax=Gossypium TaxID=3633 RepID=A0A5J5RX02_GOSBA|nr:hypothetical protein ES319_D04G114600v1 [Gossypium barbadense]TYG73695.1 hypothetical protein ES288_D04G122400v1 [Gossypium darwinii]
MGLDKYENAELIKYGFIEDIWYKKLLSSVDLTKDFFLSYSYNVMCSLQKNLYNNEPGEVLYETMFVCNEFLTRGISNHLKNTLWTVTLVYGFFKQASFSVSGRRFKLFLIARRSRHYEPVKRDDEDDSVAKMKAAEEALEAKQKVTNSLSATCSFFFIMFYNFVTNCSWYSEDIYAKLPYDSIVFVLHGCTMYFLTSLINFMWCLIFRYCLCNL